MQIQGQQKTQFGKWGGGHPRVGRSGERFQNGTELINKAQGVAKDNIDGSELQITYVDDDVMKTEGKRRNERRFTGPSAHK